MAAKKKISEKKKKAIATLLKSKDNVLKTGGMRCVTFSKSARKGGKKYAGDEKNAHSACFPAKYKAPPKTKHKGNQQGLFKACFTLRKLEGPGAAKKRKMLAPACAAIGKPIKG